MDRVLHCTPTVRSAGWEVRRRFRYAEGEGGFSLPEVLVAATILTMALTALAQLVVVSTRADGSARATTYAALLAQQKMEQLRSLAWGFDASGTPVSDATTDITSAPDAAAGGAGLGPSPPDALLRNTPGYVDHVDGSGMARGIGLVSSSAGGYTRRWSIEPLPADPTNTLVLQVVVTRDLQQSAGDGAGAGRVPALVRLLSVKTRKAP